MLKDGDKAYFMNTMTQKRLNNVLVCHVHFCRLRDIDVDYVMNVGIALNDSLDIA